MRRNQRVKRQKNLKYQKLAKIIEVILIVLIIVFCVYIFKNLHKPTSDFARSTSSENEVNAITNLDNVVQDNIINAIENVDTSNVSTSSNEPEEDKPINFTLTAIGDTLCHNTQYWDAYNSDTKEYDFSYVYYDIKYYTKVADITVGSLETTFAGEDRGYSNYPTFNSPDSLAYALKKIGVDVISLAGNHALDYGYSGLCRTIDVLDDADISHLGTYKTAEDQNKVLVKNVKGVKIAFINYTYGTNGIPVPSGKEFCLNLIDKNLISKQIEQAKEQNVDMIVACMHWGTEYKTYANSEQKELADFLFKNGVDIIIGNHPHVLEPMEKKTITLDDGSTKDVFVVYALGNFTADQRDEITRDSAILNLNITKDLDGKISINKVDYVPIYMYKNSSTKSRKFKILDIEKCIAQYDSGDTSYIDASLYSKLKVQLEKIKSILGDEIN